MEIEWDDGNRDKCQTHGVSIAEIEELLLSGTLKVFPDPTEHEERKRGVGQTTAGRNVFLVLDRQGDRQRLEVSSYQRPLHARKGSEEL